MGRGMVLCVVVAIVCVSMVLGVSSDFASLDQNCYAESESLTGTGVLVEFGAAASNVTIREQLKVVNACSGGNELEFTDAVNLTLGPLQGDEVIVEDTFVFVDTNLRPDLNVNATLRFKDQMFVVKPDVFRDGEECGSFCSGEEYDVNAREFVVNVSGFSNYSLTARQDFSLWSDEAPELQGKVYQVIDLGDGNRGVEFACIVMIFAEDGDEELVLVQTNPERQVQGRLFGDTDQQQPESLGYFPTRNGVANVYFRNELLVGYAEFEYVAQCQNNVTQLIYEETIIPVHSPLGRGFASRAVWLTTDNDGENSFFLVLYIVGVVLGIWIAWLFVRKTFGGR